MWAHIVTPGFSGRSVSKLKFVVLAEVCVHDIHLKETIFCFDAVHSMQTSPPNYYSFCRRKFHVKQRCWIVVCASWNTVVTHEMRFSFSLACDACAVCPANDWIINRKCTYRSKLFEVALDVLQRCRRRQPTDKYLFRPRHHLFGEKKMDSHQFHITSIWVRVRDQRLHPIRPRQAIANNEKQEPSITLDRRHPQNRQISFTLRPHALPKWRVGGHNCYSSPFRIFKQSFFKLIAFLNFSKHFAVTD